jgi:hypothetical protein
MDSIAIDKESLSIERESALIVNGEVSLSLSLFLSMTVIRAPMTLSERESEMREKERFKGKHAWCEI